MTLDDNLLQSIAENTFSDCTSLTTLSIKSSPEIGVIGKVPNPMTHAVHLTPTLMLV